VLISFLRGVLASGGLYIAWPQLDYGAGFHKPWVVCDVCMVKYCKSLQLAAALNPGEYIPFAPPRQECLFFVLTDQMLPAKPQVLVEYFIFLHSHV
jgi:hypothetical protein